MPDRISRPAVRLKGGLPDGIQLNGLAGADGKHFLRGEPAPKFFVGKLGRRQLIHDDEAGSDVAVLEVLELEVPAEAGQMELERLILGWRDQRTSDGTLPFHQPAYQSNDAERAVDLRHRIQVWADLNGKDPRTEWERLFGEGDQAPVGPTAASLPNLMEFCLENDIPTRDEPDEPARADEPEDDGDGEDQDDDGKLEDAAAEEEFGDEEPSNVRSVEFSGRT